MATTSSNNTKGKYSGFSGKNKKQQENLSDFVFGKKPPQARDLEEVVLGGLMLDKDAVAEVIDILKVDSFYVEAHQHIYQAIHDLFAKSEPIDILTVTEQLRKNGKLEEAGGPFYVTKLTNRVGSTANIEHHARIVSEKFILRELIRTSTKIIKESYEETTDVFELLDRAEQGLFGIAEQNLRRGYENMTTLVQKAIKEIESIKDHQEGVVGIPSGFVGLDRMTSGWQRSDMVVLAARPGMGKCLGKGTKVLMYNGQLKKVEDVVTGDWLMGDDSTPRKVLSIARGRERMYWIRQNKGMDYRVNESHILSLKRSRNEGKQKQGAVLNICVKDYLAQSNQFKSNYQGYKVAVDFSEQPLTIAPYYLGLWLGDGAKQDTTIPTTDLEVADYPYAYTTQIDQNIHSYTYKNDCPEYPISKGYMGNKERALIHDLQEVGVISNKHIPEEYLINSQENRLQLLAGLIDSDGYYDDKSNCYEIVQKDRQLSEQIKFLGDTLGFQVSIRSKKASIRSIDDTSTVYRVRLYGNIHQIPLRIERKKARPRLSPVDWQVTGIQVEYDKVDDYYGFEIDGNRLFLLEDMTVTHNTAFVLSVARNAAVDFGKGVAVFSLEMSNIQLVKRLISTETGISAEKLKRGDLRPDEWVELTTKVDKLSEAPIFIDDTPALNIFELRAKCRRLKMQHDIQMVIIDYLQLMSGTGDKKGGNREQEISMISRSLKGIAKELNVPVLALSQLSRAVETRGGDKRPQLSDLRECITGDSLIYLPDTGEYRRVDELIQEGAGFNVLSLTPEMTLEKAKCLDIWETGVKEIFEVETESGFKIKTSLNHPYFTPNGWTKLEDLTVGDYIGTARTLPYDGESSLSNDELIILAHMIGDGCYAPRQPIHYTSQDPASRAIVAEAAQRLWEVTPRIVSDPNSAQCFHVYLPSPYPLTHGVHNPFVNLLHKVGLKGARSHEKTLPDELFKCSNEQLALFIRHLWATDGCIYMEKYKPYSNKRGRTYLHYSSNSYDLITKLKVLLTRFGIHTHIQKTQKADYKPQYLLWIRSKPEVMKFAEKIGVFGIKAEKLAKAVERLKEIKTNPNKDVIPKAYWEKVKQIKIERSNLGKPYVIATTSRNISRERMNKVGLFLESDYLKNLANSDIRWEKIKQITPVGKAKTYDLRIDLYSNFVSKNILLHNSGAIEQDADMVIFLYRPEYYGFDQDEEGNSTKGTGEVIIAKHRNGPLGTVKLRFISHLAKFADLDIANNDTSPFDIPALTPLNDVITLGSKMNSDDTDEVPPF